ncbi:hypothetical protein MPTK2_3g02100 [Marchantia polymorpha subsp. ruderalis]
MKRARNRKYSAAITDVANSVAFQDHFMRRFSTWTEQPLFETWESLGSGNSHHRRPRRRSALSLAEHCGIVEGPRPQLTPLEWTKVKELSRQRKDGLNPCPICKEKFQIKEKVLLSCSHVFHRACVLSFEKYSQVQPCCPVCRTTHYEKLVLKNNSIKFKHLCATRIQTAFRGHRTRKVYGPKFRCPTDPQKRRAWFASKLENAVTPILSQMEVDESEVDALCREVDSTIAHAKKIFEAADARGGSGLHQRNNPSSSSLSSVDWHHVVEKALERGESECPICIGKLLRRGAKHKGLAWLSCSHMFHIDCISTFEKFNDDLSEPNTRAKQYLCPVCRSNYKRLDM